MDFKAFAKYSFQWTPWGQVDENLSEILRLAVPLGERHFWIEMLKIFQSVVEFDSFIFSRLVVELI